jgi:hypothetical protein
MWRRPSLRPDSAHHRQTGHLTSCAKTKRSFVGCTGAVANCFRVFDNTQKNKTRPQLFSLVRCANSHESPSVDHQSLRWCMTIGSQASPLSCPCGRLHPRKAINSRDRSMPGNFFSRGRRILRWAKGQHFPPGFDEWCDLSSSSPVKFLPPPNLETFAKSYRERGERPESVVVEFIRTITEEGKRWSSLDLNLEGRYFDQDWTFEFPLSEGSSAPIVRENTHVGNLSFRNTTNWITGDLEFINLRTSSLNLDLRKIKAPIRLVNCVIGKLTFPNHFEKPGPKCSVELHDCWIGSLTLHSRSIKNLTVTGGGIAHIDCPSSDSENPFVGTVSLKKVFFPSCQSQTRVFQGSQTYRNLCAHLKKQDNSLMANLIRSHQLRAERAEEHDRFSKFANWIYGAFANYGISPGRPVLWLCCTYILAVVACYNFDPGMLAQADSFYVGAYSVLLDENGGRYTRSFLLPFHSIINPFGVFFDTRKLIVPSTGLGSALLTIQGLFSDILLVMTALSIRRRYKAE